MVKIFIRVRVTIYMWRNPREKGEEGKNKKIKEIVENNMVRNEF